MTGKRKGNDNELVSSSRRVLLVAPAYRLSSDNTQSSPPTPPISSSSSNSYIQSPHDVDVHVEMPEFNETNTGRGDRTFIQPRGKEFTSQTKCARWIGKIIEQKFNGPWKSFKNVPASVRDLWFNKFEKDFCWRDEDRLQIRKNFDTTGSNILKNRLFAAKKSNKRPGWISQHSWSVLKEEWGKEHYKKLSAQNKKNRASNCDGQGYPKYTGGSITYLTHMEKLKNKHGREPTVAEGFMQMNSRLNLDGERVWVDKRSKMTHQAYTEKYLSLDTEGGLETLTPMTTQIKRWTEIVGGSKKGRVYGLGGMASEKFRGLNLLGAK